MLQLNLKPNDIIYFDKLQRDYQNIINYYNDLAEHMEQWMDSIRSNEHFMTKTGLDNDIRHVKSNNKNDITKQFILKICNYFIKHYSISTLTNVINTITERYVKYDFTDYQGTNDSLHYSEVVTVICEELKIDNFNNRTIDDLKSRINESLKYYWLNDRIIINNNKIKITDYGFTPHNDIWSKKVCLRYNTVKVFKDIASAYNYLTNGQPISSKDFLQWLNSISDWQNKLPNNEFYTKHEININGLKSLRFYKNRSLDITMSSKLYADRLTKVLKGEF